MSQVKTTKFLGVLIDDNLSWKTHDTTHVCNIISKCNGIIRKLRQFLPSDSLPTLFNTLVYPYINYCAIIWADNNNSHRDSILLLQKRIVRTCTNSMWLEHTNPLFQSLNTLKIRTFRVGLVNTCLAYNTIRIQGALLWNTLPTSLKNAHSINVFKRSYKKDAHGQLPLIAMYYYHRLFSVVYWF